MHHGFSAAPSTAEQACRLVTFSVSTYGTERRTTLEMSPLYLAACRCFVIGQSGLRLRWLPHYVLDGCKVKQLAR